MILTSENFGVLSYRFIIKKEDVFIELQRNVVKTY